MTKLESERLFLYPASDEEMQILINQEPDAGMKQAYSEMLQGCKDTPTNRIWNAVWFMELKDSPGVVVGDFSFKGLGRNGMVEIGYGLKEGYRHKGYMTEAVRTVAKWAMSQEGVCRVEAETTVENEASRRVLERAGFHAMGVCGEEGPRYLYRENTEQ